MRLTHYDEHKKRWQINDDYGAVMIDELNYAVGEAIDKLAAYEDAEEQGLLIRLPCKLGDTVYHIVSHTSHTVDVTGCRMEWKLEDTIEPTVFRIWMVDAIGKTIFLTHEEAETALKGTEKGR